jgi:ribosomal protein S18
MAQRRKGGGPQTKDRRPIKKKTSILTSENIEWIDYKDVNLLRRFMSERAKIRARRVTGNDQQQQAAVARDRGERGDRDAPREATASDVAETEAADAEAIEGLDVLETGEGAPTIEALVAEEE